MASGGIAGWRELDPPRFRSTGDPDRSPRPARRPLRNPVPGAGFALSSSNARERTARRPAPIDVETSSDSRVWHTGSGPRGRAARPSIGGADSRSAPSRGQLTGRSRRHQRRSARRDASDRRGQVLAGRSGRRREPPGWRRQRGRRAVQPVGYGHTGQATTALGGPHHATRPTMRSSAVMGLGR